MGREFDSSSIFGAGKFSNGEDIQSIVDKLLKDDKSDNEEDDNDESESIVNEFSAKMRQIEAKLGTKIDTNMDDNDRANVMLGKKSDDEEEENDDDEPSEQSNTRQQVKFSDINLRNMTEEQKKQQVLQNALTSINIQPMSNGENASLDAEMMRDRTNMLLEEINMLRTALSDEGTNISDVPEVDSNNTFIEIENVYKQLRYRNDHKRYFSMATELAQMGAAALEWLFDGRKSYLGFTPDLTGWGATLNIKMRRLNYEMSSVVSNGMRTYHINEMSRIMLELVPSMFIYSKTQKSKAKKGNKTSLRKAIGACRDMEDN